MRIIYLKDSGNTLSVMFPVLTEINSTTGKEFTIDEFAKKDVPTGTKYKIIEESEMPTDWSFRDAWTVDEADLTDGVGG